MILDAAGDDSVGPGDGIVGVAVDIPADGGTATFVAMCDDTTSLYTSTGGGTIGAGAHESVAVATKSLLATVQSHLERFLPGDDHGFPPRGHVRVHVLARPMCAHADIPEAAFWGEVDHELMPVIAEVQSTISAVTSV